MGSFGNLVKIEFHGKSHLLVMRYMNFFQGFTGEGVLVGRPSSQTIKLMRKDLKGYGF